MNGVITAADVAELLGTDVPDGCRGDLTITGGSIDSRTCRHGNLFFALQGTNQNGARFVDAAMKHGAIGVVSTKSKRSDCFVVEDVEAALIAVARTVRARSKAIVVAVTGSVGKTTTRRLIAAILREVDRTCESPRSFNNRLGLPLSILELQHEDRFAVFEIGTSRPGEIRELGTLARPDVAVVTAIAEAHLDGLRDLAGVASEKLSLIDCLDDRGVAVLPSQVMRLAGAPRLQSLTNEHSTAGNDRKRTRVVRHVDETLISVDRSGTSFTLSDERFRTRLLGRHIPSVVALAAEAAAAACENAGRPVPTSDQIRQALTAVGPGPGRCRPVEVGGCTIIDDTYNANPASAKVGLELLADLPADGRKIAVLAPMGELGAESARLHTWVAEHALKVANIVYLIDAGETVWGDVRSGGVLRLESVTAAAEIISVETRPGDIVLVKGSRAYAAERIVESLKSMAE